MKNFKRSIVWLLCVAMLLGMLPVVSLAAEGEAIDPSIPIFENPQYSFEERAADLVARMTLQQKASQIVNNSSAIAASQLGGGALSVPATKGIGSYTWWSETLHGTRGGVNYPQNTTVASTWNPDLYYQEATNIAQEIRERNNTNLNFYSPTINLHRDPRWGRNEESYSEDVLLTTEMGSAWVNGLEGKDRDGNVLDPDGYLMAHSTIKHYVANNNEGKNSSDETGRLRSGAVSSLRMLREYYALPYGEIIRATDVSSVMTAYSSFNGESSSYSSYLMDTLLRQIYGLSGYITSDCDSVASMQNLHMTNQHTGEEITMIEALSGALAHGEDLECNGGHSSSGSGTSGFKTDYKAQMNAMIAASVDTDMGKFTEESVDIAVHRLMVARMQTGDFDGEIQIEKDAAERNSNTLRDTVRRPLVEQINNEGIVMLQNEDNFLPLDLSENGVKNVAIVGAWQTNGNTGLYAQASGNQLNIQAGIREAFQEVYPDVTITTITSNSPSAAQLEQIAAADAVIVVTGTSSGYSAEDRDRASIILPDNQENLINTVAAQNPNTVVVMETCGPMRVRTFQDNVKSILWSSFGGQWKNGFGDIIAGLANPSGKTTDTWYQDVSDTGESDVPPVTDYDMLPSEGKNGRTYMYYNGEKEPSYPFGYGLSYTTFEYSDLTIDKTAYDANETVKVSFKVKNTGDVAGKEVAQLYIAQPDAPAELQRPIRRLEGFKKTEMLEPGASETITLEVKIEDLAFFNEEADCFEVDTGKYQVQVGASSAAANLTKDFTVSGELTEVPAVVTMKANQDGDKAQGIEHRLIFGKGKEVNPQLTVSMNNEKLYGYIIANQKSPIKQMKSCDLPEGMEVTYTSNRPNVVKVEGDKIVTVGPGVATLTAAVTYNGVTVTGEEIIYVMSSLNVDDITIDGETIAKFSPKKYNYTVKLEAGDKIPVVAASTENPDLEITVNQATELPGIATIVSTDKDSGVSATYTIVFKVKATGAAVSNIDFTALADSGKYDILGQTQSEVEEGEGLKLIATRNAIETCNDQNSGTQAETPEDLVKVPIAGEKWVATLEVDFATNGAANGYYQFFGFFAADGDDYQNMAGIRGGDGAMQNFLRTDGSIVADSADLNSAPGFASDGTYWFQIEKNGDTYICRRSSDGDEFTDMFTYEATGLDAESLIIDAYTGMTEGYAFTLKALTIEQEGAGLPNIDFTTLADSGKYDIVGQTQSEVAEGEGLALVATRNAVETCNDQNSGTQAETPEDLVLVPVSGDWTATLEVDFATNGAANGYYQFFGFYAAEGDDYQNMAGIRGGDGAMQNFLRTDGSIVADSSDLNSAPGFASEGAYWLQIEKEGTTYTCLRSSDGEDFTEMFKYTDTDIDAEYIVIDAYTGMTEGYKFTLKSLNFEGGVSSPDVETVVPEVASITVDGEAIGFDANIKDYMVMTERGGKAPVIAATAGNKDTKIEIAQPAGAIGVGTVKATAGNKTITYTLSFGAMPENDYFADGEFDAALWEILNENEETYSVEAGKGIVLPTQANDIYQTGTGWENAFTMSALGNWEAVVKLYFPVAPAANYQQGMFLVWDDEDNYFRMNGQYKIAEEEGSVGAMIIEPGVEANGTFTASEGTTLEVNEDGSMTLYLKIKQDGNTYTGAYSTDGQEFVEIFSGDVALSNPKLALFATENSAAEQIDVEYEYVYMVAVGGLQPDYVAMQDWATENVANYIAAALPAETSEDIVLAAAPAGYEVTLSSSNPAVIDADGKVTPAAAATDVELTVSVKNGSSNKEAKATVKVLAAGEKPHVHAWGEWKVTTAATCTAKGVETRTCSGCNETETHDIAALGHDYGEWKVTTAATCTEKGVETRECSRCDAKETRDIAALGHKFEDGICTVCGEKDPATHDCPSKDFTDVPALNDWAHAGIDYCVEEGLMNGTSATLFSPANSLTRAQIATILYRIAGEPEVEYKAVFSDVADDIWYTDAIIWAAEEEIVNGYPGGTFAPNKAISREQIATILYRYAGSPKAEEDLKDYPDADSVSDWAKDAMAWAVEKGLINGIKSGEISNLAPQKNATRAQFATIIMRFQALKADLPELGDSPEVTVYPVSVNKALYTEFAGGAEGYFAEGFQTGFGSGITFKGYDADGNYQFYGITDRGPSLDLTDKDGNEVENTKVFPSPDFTPSIGIITLKDGKAVIEESIQLKNTDGSLLKGLPLPAGELGSTGEIAFDIYGEELTYDPNGFDPEGIAVDKDGNFWLADEYGPYIGKFSPDGTLIKMYKPGDGLPEILKYRIANRGFEGLSISPSGKIFATVQSVLDVDGKTAKTASFIRIVELDPETGASKMYAYPVAVSEYSSPKNCKIGDVFAVDDETLLMVEQGKLADKSMRNIIYKVSLKDATDISDLSYNGKELEYTASAEELSSVMSYAEKEVFVDLRTLNWTAEKAEGLCLTDDGALVAIIEDDFGLAGAEELADQEAYHLIPYTGDDSAQVWMIR